MSYDLDFPPPTGDNSKTDKEKWTQDQEASQVSEFHLPSCSCCCCSSKPQLANSGSQLSARSTCHKIPEDEAPPPSNLYLMVGPYAIGKLDIQNKSLKYVCDISCLSFRSTRFAVWKDQIYHLTSLTEIGYEKPVGGESNLYCYNSNAIGSSDPKRWEPVDIGIVSSAMHSYLVVVNDDDTYIFNRTASLV